MQNSGKTAQWPETIPRHLLRLLRPVRHDEKALKEVLSDRRSLRSSKKNGKAYEFVLKSTNEKLDVHDYPLFKVLYPKTRPRWAIQSLDCILVAKGGCLPESIILGRNKDLPHMELRMWKGKENYEDAVEVEKRYESEEEDDLQSYEDSNERAAKSAVNYIGKVALLQDAFHWV